MANPTLLEQFCADGQKDLISETLKTTGWSPDNPYVNGYQMNRLFNEIFQYLNYLKNKGLSFWEDKKPYKATDGDIDIVRYANKIYFAKLDSNLDGLTPKSPDTNPTYWGVLYDLDKPLETTYALIGGSSTQIFKAKDGVDTDDVVTKAQLDLKAYIGGSSTQIFKAKDGVDTDDVVTKAQLDLKAYIGGSSTQIFKAKDGVDINDVVTKAQLDLKIGLSDFSSNFATSGYQKIAGGMIIQWGRDTTNTGNTITYPISFPNSVLSIHVTGDGEGGYGGIGNVGVYNVGTAQFSWHDEQIASDGVWWVAIGH